MGCGASRVVQAIDENQDKSPESPEHQQQPEELTSVRSTSPDLASKPVDRPSTAPVIQQNGTESSAPDLEDQLPEATFEKTSAHSGNECIYSSKGSIMALSHAAFRLHGDVTPHPFSHHTARPGLLGGTLYIARSAPHLYTPCILHAARPFPPHVYVPIALSGMAFVCLVKVVRCVS